MGSTWGAYSFFTRAKNKVLEVMKPVANLTSAAESTYKSAFGIHYMFNLVLKCFPGLNSYSNIYNACKYTVTSISFAVLTYYEYNKKNVNRNYQHKMQTLNESFAEGSVLINKVNRLFSSSNNNTKAAGYGSIQRDNEIIIEIDLRSEHPFSDKRFDKKPAHQKPTITQTNKACDSSPMLIMKSIWDGLIASTLVYYIFDMEQPHEKQTYASQIICQVFMATALFGRVLYSYDSRITELKEKLNARILDIAMIDIIKDLEKASKKLGTDDELKATLLLAEEMIGEPIQSNLNCVAMPNESQGNYFDSKQFLILRSILNGIVFASSIEYLLEILCPNLTLLRYLIAGIAQPIAAWSQYKSYKDSLHFQKKIDYFYKIYNTVSASFESAKRVVDAEEKQVAKMKEGIELTSWSPVPEANDLLEAAPEELIRYSNYKHASKLFNVKNDEGHQPLLKKTVTINEQKNRIY